MLRTAVVSAVRKYIFTNFIIETMKTKQPSHLVLSAGNGAVEATEHCRVTGHKIEVFSKKEILPSKGRRQFMDFTQKYKCTQCDFESFNGKRYEN